MKCNALVYRSINNGIIFLAVQLILHYNDLEGSVGLTDRKYNKLYKEYYTRLENLVILNQLSQSRKKTCPHLISLVQTVQRIGKK